MPLVTSCLRWSRNSLATQVLPQSSHQGNGFEKVETPAPKNIMGKELGQSCELGKDCPKCQLCALLNSAQVKVQL